MRAAASSPVTLTLPSPEATSALAARLGAVLAPGDALLLSGGLGAGKTHFARALIQSRLAVPEDVPSPTYTLVQTYETPETEIWHADLYRLSGPDEVVELGLAEAFDTAICLVEWPDRLGEMAPDTALRVTLEDGPDDDSRRLTLHWEAGDWAARLVGLGDPAEAFLSRTGWAGAARAPLAGDASARHYTRLTRGSETAVLMHDPDGDTARFARLARFLTGLGLSAPRVMAEAPGLLLLEDLGDGLVSRLATDPDSERRLYLMAVHTLLALHGHAAPAGLETASPDHLAEAIAPAFTWYARDPDLFPAARAAFRPLLAAHAAPADVLVLRDCHAANLLALPGRSGAARTGLLDFQDALIGHPAYDLVSLCRDPRRDLHPGTEAACLAAYLDATGEEDRGAFETAYALLGVQRNLRILGIFARLAQRDGKPGYLDFLPRTHAHVMAQAQHPALAPLRRVLDALPVPTPDVIADLGQPCPTP